MSKHYGNLISWSSLFISIFSLIGIATGTLSINYALTTVFFTSFMDLFDGRVARKFITKDCDFVFGELTDSLCDIVNFSIFPMMVYLYFFLDFSLIPIMVMFLFIWAAAFRLARFSRDKDLISQRIYLGLPVTISGPLSVLLTLLFQESLLLTSFSQIVIIILMISTIKIKKL